MKAVTTHQGHLEVADVPDLVPGPGQILIDVLRCGICGSDLHARTHGDVTADGLTELGYQDFIRSQDTVVLGHEFVGTVAAYGPQTRRAWKPGSRVVAMPMLGTADGVHLTGLSPKAPGGYAEQVLVSEALTFPVPDKVSDDHAALTEPLAVAHHAVRRSGIGAGEVAVVVGCGPIGLAVILLLKAAGVKTVVASDLSDARRELARRCGADIVVDPRETGPFDAYGKRRGHLRTAPALFDLALSSMKALRRVPGLPWARLMRLAEKAGQVPKGPVVFECVGVPGMIDAMVSQAPLRSRVIVVGVCMEPDTIRPSIAIAKEMDLRFVFGYDPAEFHETLQWIASGRIDPTPLITGTVGLAGVSGAFDDLAAAGKHAKILVDPRATGG